MKLCPLCSSTYADRVDFCFRDGTPLVRDGAEGAADLGARSSEDLPTPESGKPYRDDTFDTEVLFDPDTGDYATTSPRELDELVDDPPSADGPEVVVDDDTDGDTDVENPPAEADDDAPTAPPDEPHVDDALLGRNVFALHTHGTPLAHADVSTPVGFDLEGHPLADPLDAPEPPEAIGRARDVERIASGELGLHAKGAKALGPGGVVVPAGAAAPAEADAPAIAEPAPAANAAPIVPDVAPAPVAQRRRSPVSFVVAFAAVVLAVIGIGVLSTNGSLGSRTAPAEVAATTPAPVAAAPVVPPPVVEPAPVVAEEPPLVEETVVAVAPTPEPPPTAPKVAEPKKPAAAPPIAATTAPPVETETAVASLVLPDDENPWGVASAARKGLLRIDGSPKGARVSVNDEPQGIVRDGAPVELEVSVGEDYRIRIEKDGYLAYSKVVSVHAKEPVSVPYDLKIAVTSGQARLVGEVGSTVYIDASSTPIPIPSSVQLSEGRHSFRVVLANGETITLAKTIAFDGNGVPPVVTLSSGL